MAKKSSKNNKPQRPKRDEFELEDIAQSLMDAHEYQTEIELIIWQKEPVRGIVSQLDGQTQRIHIQQGYGTVKVPFIDILKVSSV